MSAVYHRKDWDAAFAKGFQEVDAYVSAHPGTDIAAMATALALPYEVVFAACVSLGCVMMPNSSGEVHFVPAR